MNSSNSSKRKSDSLKALSVRQPWAWFLVNGHKDVENRSWKPSHKMIGKRIVIHASKRRLTKADFQMFLEIVKDRRIKRYPKSIEAFDYGALLGSVVIRDVVRGAKSYWAFRGNYHWIVDKARKMKPKKKKGQLLFFDV